MFYLRICLLTICVISTAFEASAMFYAMRTMRSFLASNPRAFGAVTLAGCAYSVKMSYADKAHVRSLLERDKPDFEAFFQYVEERQLDPNTSFDEKYPPLIYAAFNDNVDALIKLYEQGANINVQDCRGTTPLIWAIGRDNLAMVEAILKCPDLDVNLADNNGTTPLMKAVNNFSMPHDENTEQIVKALLNHPYIDVNKRSSSDSNECALNSLLNPLFPFNVNLFEMAARKRALELLLKRDELDTSIVKIYAPWVRDGFRSDFERFNIVIKE